MPRWRKQGTREERSALATLAGEAAAEAALAGAAVAEVEAGLAIPPDLTAAAFFDVDNTMMRGASIFYFARGLAARKFLTSGALASFGWQQLKFRTFGKELSPAAIRTSRERALSFVAGRPTRLVVELVRTSTTS